MASAVSGFHDETSMTQTLQLLYLRTLNKKARSEVKTQPRAQMLKTPMLETNITIVVMSVIL